MSWYWILAGGLLLVLAVSTLYYTNTFRYAKSLVLIMQTSPYEQVGTGAGRILVLGDSTGYGTGVKDSRESIAGRIGIDFPAYTIVNLSVNGDTVEKAIAREDSIEGEFDLVLLQLGANNIIKKVSLEKSLSDIQVLKELLSEHTKQVVMMSSGNVGGAAAFTGAEQEEYERLSRKFHQAVANYAETEPGFTYLHFFEEPNNDPFVLDPETYMAMDGLHPSGAGYGLWYQELKPILDLLLSKE